LDIKAIQLTAELFSAIRLGDVAATKAALEHGADVNRPNWISYQPLDWAALMNKPELARLLLSQGATTSGGANGTALVTAILGGHEAMALELLRQGISKEAKRPDKATTLMLAAAYSTPPVLTKLPQDAAELAQQDIDGATALIYGARLGKTANVKLLLAAGAKTEQTDSHGRTALHYAAMNGFPETVDALLKAGASAKALDKTGATPLHLAARYSTNPQLAKSLVKAGAGLSGRDSTGKTALGLAQARRHTALALVLKAAGARPEPMISTPAARPAIQKSITAMETGMTRFLSRSDCSSCHHQGLGLAVLGNAALRGFAVNRGIIKGNLDRIGEVGQQAAPLMQLALTDPTKFHIVPTSEMEEFPIGASYTFWALDANQVPANPGLSGMAEYVARQQQNAGNWSFILHRGPMQESFQTMTALQVLGMRRFLEKDKSAESLKKAHAWFQKAPTTTIEDRASRLLGLRWSGSDTRSLQSELTPLAKLQNADGGWSGKPGAPSDPLTTGLALYSLRVGGAAPLSHPAVRKATDYLLRHQDESGAWYVNKTVAPFNYYFDGGFPGGESQYVSFAATGWATLALMESTDAPKVKTARR
jgi:ankyrin repeat protein